MTNQDSGNKPTTNPKKEPLSESPMGPTTPQKNKVGKDSQSGADSKDDRAINLIRTGEYWLIGINGAAIILNFIIALIYWGQLGQMRESVKIAHETFVSTNRPSVGVNGILPLYVGLNNANQAVYSAVPTKQSTNFVLRVELKNFGSVTAEDFWITWKIFINGVLVPKDNEEMPRHSKIYPGKFVYLPARIGTADTPGISDGTKILELEVTVHNKAPEEDYAYCEKHRYEPSVHAFMNLGACP